MKALWLAGSFAALFISLALTERWNAGWDSAVYLELADSLQNGAGYSYQGHDFAKFPPGLPLLLAALMKLGATSLLALRLVGVISCAVLVAAAFALARRHGDNRCAVFTALCTTISFPVLRESTLVLTDLPLAATTLLFVLAAERVLENGSRRALLVACALMLVATSLRLAGATFGFALCAVFLLRRRWNPAAWMLVATLALPTLWIWHGTQLNHPLPVGMPEASAYLTEIRSADFRSLDAPAATFADLGLRVLTNLGFYARGLGALAGVHGETAGALVGALLALLCLAGLVVHARRHNALPLACVLTSAGLYLLWPALEERFLIPLWPLLLFGFSVFVPRTKRGTVVLVVAALAMLGLHLRDDWRLIRTEHTPLQLKGHLEDEHAAFAWMRANLPANAVIIADRGPICARLSGLKSFAFPRTANAQHIADTFRQLGATHLLMNRREHAQQYLPAVLALKPGAFEEVHRLNDQVLYALKP